MRKMEPRAQLEEGYESKDRQTIEHERKENLMMHKGIVAQEPQI